MNWLRRNKIVAVHSGRFHADDAFAVAMVSLYLGYIPKIIRTREEKILAKADFVLDVGRVYDPALNKFDHHSEGWNVKRDNGILYAASGLVWKEFGSKICGSSEVAAIIDKNIIQGIDANDNGISISKNIFEGVKVYSIFDYIFSFNTTWREESKNDEYFKKTVIIAKDILVREIFRAKDLIEGEKDIQDIYSKTENKSILILEKPYDYMNIVERLPEVLFVISPRSIDNTWHINAVSTKGGLFERRKELPSEWAGKSGEEFQKITGDKDAVFCHNKRFVAVSKSKEGAIELAKKALVN